MAPTTATATDPTATAEPERRRRHPVLTIWGVPIAKHRPKFARRGKFVTVYSDQTKQEKKIKAKLKEQIKEKFEGAVEIECLFVMPRPKSHFGTGKNAGTLKKSAPVLHIKKPDTDNLLKWICDCLNNIAYKDDSCIVKITGLKVYGIIPCTEIKLNEVKYI